MSKYHNKFMSEKQRRFIEPWFKQERGTYEDTPLKDNSYINWDDADRTKVKSEIRNGPAQAKEVLNNTIAFRKYLNLVWIFHNLQDGARGTHEWKNRILPMLRTELDELNDLIEQFEREAESDQLASSLEVLWDDLEYLDGFWMPASHIQPPNKDGEHQHPRYYQALKRFQLSEGMGFGPVDPEQTELTDEEEQVWSKYSEDREEVSVRMSATTRVMSDLTENHEVGLYLLDLLDFISKNPNATSSSKRFQNQKKYRANRILRVCPGCIQSCSHLGLVEEGEWSGSYKLTDRGEAVLEAVRRLLDMARSQDDRDEDEIELLLEIIEYRYEVGR